MMKSLHNLIWEPFHLCIFLKFPINETSFQKKKKIRVVTQSPFYINGYWKKDYRVLLTNFIKEIPRPFFHIKGTKNYSNEKNKTEKPFGLKGCTSNNKSYTLRGRP